MMNDELLFCIPLEDPSGEFEAASELLNALELDFSSYFDRENCSVRHTVYHTDPESAAECREQIKNLLPLWQEIGVTLNMGDTFSLQNTHFYSKVIPK